MKIAMYTPLSPFLTDMSSLALISTATQVPRTAILIMRIDLPPKSNNYYEGFKILRELILAPKSKLAQFC